MKKLLNFFLSLLTLDFIASFSITAFVGSFFGTALGLTPFTGFAILTAVLALAGFASPGITANAPFQMGLNKQIWISQLMENFYSEVGHLMRSQDMTTFVDFNTINLAEAGVAPEVLINNNTYPINVVERSDTALTIQLDRYRTENTVLRDAETIELAYNKMESVIRNHRSALRETTLAKATHAWAPSANGTYTPVYGTTGADRGDGSNRKALKVNDIAKAKRLFDKLKVPASGRVLVLCPEHQEDLINADAQLFKTFANLRTGEILQLFGFDIYVSSLTASYDKTAGTKNAYGSAFSDTDDSPSSLFYHEAEVMRADGDVKMFDSLNDPHADGDLIGFAKRFVGMPIRNKYIGSIYSAAV